VGLDLVPEVAHAEDDLPRAVPPEQIELVVNERAAGDRDQRFRQVGGEVAEPRRPPARQDRHGDIG
jgi:hypothetical protein